MNKQSIAREVQELAESVGWRVNEVRLASTGSIYVEVVRQEQEWAVIRVADHKQVYHRWLTTYSVAPGDLWFEELEDILTKPFGAVGDIL
jgi:hypothetical protein